MSPLARRAGIAVLLGSLVVGCPASPESAGNDEASAGHLELDGASPTTFNAPSAGVRLRVVGATLDPAGEPPFVAVNGKMVKKEAVLVTADAITLAGLVLDEQNEIDVLAWDASGGELTLETTLWAGTNALEVRVLDENGQPLSGATVRASLGADRTVFAEALSVDGKARFVNLPPRTIALDARAEGNRFATLPTTGTAGSASLRFVAWSPASSVDNNAFQQGTAGWTASNGSAVKLVAHDEGGGLAFRADTATDMDLVLQTLGVGAQTLSRTFVVKAGTKACTLRYRFITSEVPGGYFGTRFDDYFTVTMRSKRTGRFVQQGDSMNAMGLSAFSAGGATSWREIPLLVEPGDTVQVDLSVANVADGLYDSSVVVDMVQERSLVITQAALADIDGAPLGYLSAAPHPYFGGDVRVNGTIRLEGAKGDVVDYVHLDVLQRGQVVAIGDLVPDATRALIGKFGDDEKLEIAATGPLFAITSAQIEGVDGREDGKLTLRASARSTKGEKAAFELGSVPLLVRYTGPNRYNERDVDVGGDDWARPSTKKALDHFSAAGIPGFAIGDVSNMNAGHFVLHSTHAKGIDADLWFDGYNQRDAATAERLLEMLNDPTYGPRIERLVVTYPRKAGNPFFDTIADVTLEDGRQAADVIKSETSKGIHDTHFHARFQ